MEVPPSPGRMLRGPNQITVGKEQCVTEVCRWVAAEDCMRPCVYALLGKPLCSELVVTRKKRVFRSSTSRQ